MPTGDAPQDAARIATLETSQARLHQDVQQLGHSLERLASDTRDQITTLATNTSASLNRFAESNNNSLKELSDKFSASQSKGTPWSVIISAFSLAVVIIGFVISVPMRDIGKVETSTAALRSELIGTIDSSSELLIQIQAEGQKLWAVHTENLERRLAIAEESIVEHDKGVRNINSTQSEQIRSLERQVFNVK